MSVTDAGSTAIVGEFGIRVTVAVELSVTPSTVMVPVTVTVWPGAIFAGAV